MSYAFKSFCRLGLLGLWLFGGFGTVGAQAQVVVPTFGTRGAVAPELFETFMRQLRQEIARQTGLRIDEGEPGMTGIASSLDPELTYLLAQLGGGRYALSGEIRRTEGGGAQAPYAVSILIVDEQAERSSDIISEPFSEANVAEVVARLATQVTRFVMPAGVLESGEAQLFVSSQPGEARVFINGYEVGETSSLDVLMLKPGDYEIELRKEGFLPATRKLTLSGERPEFVNILLTALVGGSIQVSSQPKADVYINGELKGRSPLTEQVNVGTYTVTLQRPGFELLRVEVPVQQYRVSQVSQTMTPIFERMLFWDVSSAGLLLVDGVLRTGGFLADVAPGPHTIEARVGGESYAFAIDVPATGVYEIDVLNAQLRPFIP